MGKPEVFISIRDYMSSYFKTFGEEPINEVDMAVFSKVVYFCFEVFLTDDRKKIKISELNRLEKRKAFLTNQPYGENDVSFLTDLTGNPRFRDVICTHFVHTFTTDRKVEQYGAISFILPTDEVVISFRGTDDSLNGWKEDFNMAIYSPVPSQKDAFSYLKKYAYKEKRPIYLTGHSKGGNLAVYSYLSADKTLQSKIRKVYSFDGPGLNEKLEARLHYNEKKQLITKLIPYESIVGQIYSSPEGCDVIKASSRLLFQHSLYNWHLTKDFRFERVPSMSKSVNDACAGLNKWLGECNEEDKQMIIETLFNMLQNSNITTPGQIMNSKTASVINIIDKYQKLDKKIKVRFNSLFRKLFKNIYLEML